MRPPYLFRRLEEYPWWGALKEVERSLRARESRMEGASESSYARLLGELIAAGHASLPHAVAAALLEGEPSLERQGGELPHGLRTAALGDLALLRSLLARDWHGEVQTTSAYPLPCPTQLSSASDGDLDAWARRLASDDEGEEELLEALLAHYRTCGTGIFAKFLAFRWRSGRLEGVPHPSRDRLADLMGLERQLEQLSRNVERFLAGAPALHTLLYGSRGSGKSTAARALLHSYSDDGLRLVEVSPESLVDLPSLSESLRNKPHRYLLFIDDLSFESGDAAYHPLKSLLEGSVAERPENVLLLATSNRRHLIRESFRERPLPEDDDVHAWDTSNERLALADRFGLTITFPGADQRRYLVLVRQLARQGRVTMDDGQLERLALQFADWGNGYSGRTARQFVDTLL